MMVTLLEMRKNQVDRLQWEREALEAENERLRAALYSAQQIALMWGVSLSTIRRKEARGEMPPRVRISERRFGYRAEDIAKMVEGGDDGLGDTARLLRY